MPSVSGVRRLRRGKVVGELLEKLMDNQKAIDTIRRVHSDEEVRRVQAQYMAEMKPLNDGMTRVLQMSIPTAMLSSTGRFEGFRYNAKTQEAIDYINQLRQSVTDHYRKNYPELFEYV